MKTTKNRIRKTAKKRSEVIITKEGIVAPENTLFPRQVAKMNDILSRTIFVKEEDLVPGMINMNPNLANTPGYRSPVTPTHPL